VIGNILLVLGASMFFGGLRRDRQRFNATAASAQSSMLLLAIAAAVMPAVLALVTGAGLPLPGSERTDFSHDLESLSLITAVVLIGVYAGGLVFSLRTHRDLFNPTTEEDVDLEPWSTRRSVLMLAIAGVAVAVMSEILVGSISEFADSAGVSQFFIGAIIVAIVGNAAEHWVAVLVARKDQMDLAVNIAIGSSAQIALFVMPILVLASYIIGPGPLALVFNGFELAALVLAALIANQVTQDGESTWFEGLQLLAVYAIVAVAFFVA
jgi:Ca2+:H+ antiporter